MLRINLLPPYIYDKQKKVRLALVWAAVVAAALGLFLLWFVTLNTKLSEQKDLEAKATELSNKSKAVQADIAKEKQARNEIENRQTFIAAAQTYNDAWPAAFETMRDVTANNILLKSMAFDKDRKTVFMTGFAKNEEDIVRWWEYLRNNYAGPDASLPFEKVVFGLPGHPYPAKDSAAGGAGGNPGAKGFGGGSAGGFSGPTMAGASGFGSSGPSGGYPGASGFGGRGAGGGTDDKVGPGVIEGRPGINFTASVTLKKPVAGSISTPIWPSGGAAPAGSGGFGGGAPGPGGMPNSGGMPGSGGGGRPMGGPTSGGTKE